MTNETHPTSFLAQLAAQLAQGTPLTAEQAATLSLTPSLMEQLRLTAEQLDEELRKTLPYELTQWRA